MIDEDQGGLLTVAEAALRVNVSKATVKAWIRRGLVVSVLWDGKRMVGVQSLYDVELATRSVGRPRSDRSAG